MLTTHSTGSRSNESRGGSGPIDASDTWGPRGDQAGKGIYSLQGGDMHYGGDALVDSVLGDHWWQTGGVPWLGTIDVPEGFVTDGHMNIDDYEPTR